MNTLCVTFAMAQPATIAAMTTPRTACGGVSAVGSPTGLMAAADRLGPCILNPTYVVAKLSRQSNVGDEEAR